MKTRELIQKIQKFHDDLETHYYLWGQSLHPSLPEYPLKNVEELRKQTNNLARQLGALRPYIDQLSPSTILRAAGQEWDAYDSAASNDVAVRKGASISAVLPQLQQILGRLEAMDLESEFSLLSATEQQSVIAQANATSLSMAKFICAKFHVAAKQLEDRYENRPTLRIKDEYDVQDLLHVLLRVHFEDIRPSYAGTSSRVDFLLKSEQIVIEAKITRPGRGNKEIANELTIDVARYRSHHDCKKLICLIYDAGGVIKNPRGFQADLTQLSDSRLEVFPIITP
jgi:hypothetical protein